MILQPYGSKIIGQHINSAQGSYTSLFSYGAFGVLALYTLSRAVESYLHLVAVESYLHLVAVESYLHLVAVESYLHETPKIGFIAACVSAFLLLTSVDPSDKNADLLELLEDNTDENQQSPQTGDQSEQQDIEPEVGAYGYARQSQSDSSQSGSDEDREDTSSIKAQRKNIISIADEEVDGQIRIFKDIDETGFSFDRPGINELQQHLEQEPKPIVLDRINRFGRDTLETIFVVAKIYYEYNIPIITHRYGRYDLSSTNDQVRLVIEAITAGKAVEGRIRAAMDAIRSNFAEDRRWYSWFGKIRVGYEPGDDDWIEPAPAGKRVMKAIMRDFCEIGGYEPVIELIESSVENKNIADTDDSGYELNNIAGKEIESVFEKSDYSLESLSGQKLKNMLRERIYVGEVRYPLDRSVQEQAAVEDQNLRLVDDDLHIAVLRTIAEIERTESSTEETIDTHTLAERGQVLKTTNAVDCFNPTCHTCNRAMVKNGEADLGDGQTGHYWICPNYAEDRDSDEDDHAQRKFPYDTEWEEIQREIEGSNKERSDIVVLRICQITTDESNIL